MNSDQHLGDTNTEGDPVSGIVKQETTETAPPLGDQSRQLSRKFTLASSHAPRHRRIKHLFHFDTTRRFYLFILVVPTIISLWYAAAILFPPSWRENCPLLIWTDSAQSRNASGQFTICPRPSICSEGAFQVFLISVARLTAFASYVVQGIVFVSKMHSTIHFLSQSYAASLIPFESLHHVHAMTGSTYAALAFFHTIAHLIRWGVRSELGEWCSSNVGLSGIFAMLSMAAVVFVMSPWGKKLVLDKKKMTFENRFTSHWIFFWTLTICLCLHVKRTRQITLAFFFLWLADYLYGLIFRTHRLDVVEFAPLPEGCGTQMLWKNPPGFHTRAGEFVRVQVPWLDNGGNQWHPFSIYLKEATKEGMDEVNRREKGRVFVGEDSKGGRHIDLQKTGILLVELQNEFAHPNGGLYDNVKEVMESTNTIPNIQSLVATARTVGVPIIHAPIVVAENGSGCPNAGLGILKAVKNGKFFRENTWNSQIIDELKPEIGDKIVEDKKGLDCFPGSNLEDILVELGVETLVIGGLLTNCCVESTMRTAYEKGFNTITLIDGTACNSKAEQIAAVTTTFEMFSTPMKCSEVEDIFKGVAPLKASRTTYVEDQDILEKGADSLFSEEEMSLEEFCRDVFASPFNESVDVATIARQGLKQNETTQIFIMPAGDWTKGLAKEVAGRQQMRSCWVRGPYTSPYFVVSSFSHSVLMASGIGITPALGVMGQYTGKSKTKILIWSVRCKKMLKFFAPLLGDAHLVAVFYTGKDKLTIKELSRIKAHGDIFVQQSRPKSLVETIASLIVLFERQFAAQLRESGGDMERTGLIRNIRTMNDIPEYLLETWVLLYCGGSTRIRDELALFANKSGIGWHAELFDW